MVNWIHFPKNKPLDKVSAQIVKAFEAVDATIDSYTHQLKSDEVLTAVRPGLEALGFDVEKSKKSDDLVAVPVLYGVNGKIEKAFEADGYLSTAGYVIEVEAGRAVVNYQFLKDFFEACTMVGVDKLCIAVRNKYRAFNDFDRVCKFFEAMSAGICIMNRNAIAMAADSAVTVGDHAAIHNSANKLFSLSRVAPVGVIVYANAALMTVPIEIIVKQYKKQLADRVFPKLNDYVNDFLDYLRDKSQFFRFDINEQTYVLQVFSDLMRGLLGDYRIIMSSEQNNSGKPLDENGMKKVAESAVSSTITFVNGIKKRADYHFGEYIENHYLNTFVDLVKKDQNLQWLTDK